jgi:hypothetical protein
MSQFPTSPFGNGNSYFGSEINHRDRSFSNRSTRSSLYGSEFFEPNRFPSLQFDLAELMSEKQHSGSENNSFLYQPGRPSLSPFQRATSRGSGAGSGSGSGGSGSGSGSGSPKSARD